MKSIELQGHKVYYKNVSVLSQIMHEENYSDMCGTKDGCFYFKIENTKINYKYVFHYYDESDNYNNGQSGTCYNKGISLLDMEKKTLKKAQKDYDKLTKLIESGV